MRRCDAVVRDSLGGGEFERAASAAAANAFGALIGNSEPMCDMRRRLAAAARTRSTVLLSGATGTGKGLAARLLHGATFAAGAPFVHVDCASLASNLIESELFGHERGAFTGATQRRAGRFEMAASGTLFLDEIGELAPLLQAKLLRVLQDREFERIGGTRTLPMSARIVAATNRDLATAVRRRRFRADLYFRLKVVHVRVPSLRERESDVAALIDDALARLCPRLARRRPSVSPGFLAALDGYAWPGNVRELANAVERLLVSGVDPWQPEHASELFEADTGEQSHLVASREAGSADRERVAAALAQSGGNVARAATALDLPRSTLRYRIAKYRLGDRTLALRS